jgi:hypothetical protein
MSGLLKSLPPCLYPRANRCAAERLLRRLLHYASIVFGNLLEFHRVETIDSQTMFRRRIALGVILVLLASAPTAAQQIREYTARRATSAVLIDGRLDETDWKSAAPTEKFVLYLDGSSPRLTTQAKVLWDDQNLYVGFICTDPDVWATMTTRDTTTWNEEIAEVLCDPDGDEKNYFEVETNQLGAVFDCYLEKPYDQGGWDISSWNLAGLKVGIGVNGTINNSADTDSGWTCEMALPFQSMARFAPSLSFPPRPGDVWRMLFGRQEFERTGARRSEITCWNQTDVRGFHVPSKFGRVTFSNATSVSVEDLQTPPRTESNPELLGNYPNPFNPKTVVSCQLSVASDVRLSIYDLLGREVMVLLDEKKAPGHYEVVFNAVGLCSGTYVCRLRAGHYVCSRTIVLMK